MAVLVIGNVPLASPLVLNTLLKDTKIDSITMIQIAPLTRQ